MQTDADFRHLDSGVIFESDFDFYIFQNVKVGARFKLHSDVHILKKMKVDNGFKLHPDLQSFTVLKIENLGLILSRIGLPQLQNNGGSRQIKIGRQPSPSLDVEIHMVKFGARSKLDAGFYRYDW